MALHFSPWPWQDIFYLLSLSHDWNNPYNCCYSNIICVNKYWNWIVCYLLKCMFVKSPTKVQCWMDSLKKQRYFFLKRIGSICFSQGNTAGWRPYWYSFVFLLPSVNIDRLSGLLYAAFLVIVKERPGAILLCKNNIY